MGTLHIAKLEVGALHVPPGLAHYMCHQGWRTTCATRVGASLVCGSLDGYSFQNVLWFNIASLSEVVFFCP